MMRGFIFGLEMAVVVTVIVAMAAKIFSLRAELDAVKADQDKGVYVLCRFDLKPEADLDDYVAKTLAVVPTVRAEAGCLGYALVKDADTGDWSAPMKFGERTMWCVERWSSLEALKAHLETPHMKAFGPTVRGMRSASTFHVLESAAK